MRKGKTVEQAFAVNALLKVVKHGMDPTADPAAPSTEALTAAKEYGAIQRRHKGPAGKMFGDLMLANPEAGMNVVVTLVKARRTKIKPSRRQR